MTQYTFGVGTVIGKRVDIANTAVAFFGTTQEWSLDFNQEVVTLVGSNKVAVDSAPGELKITGKIKFARLQSSTFGNMLFGAAPVPSSGFDIIGPENHAAIPATTFTVTSGATFTEDLGLFYHNTGVALQPVTAAPGVGQYIPGVPATGTYTINVADESVTGGIDAFYMVSLATLFETDLNQTLMGSGPVIELDFATPYTVQASVKKFNVQVFSARVTKMPWAFKNKGYMVPEMDFTVFANAAGQILRTALTE